MFRPSSVWKFLKAVGKPLAIKKYHGGPRLVKRFSVKGKIAEFA